MVKSPIDPLLQQHLNLSNSLGPELTTNGTFTGSADGWTLGSGWTYSANTADKDGAGTATLSQAVGAVANKVYLVSYVLTVSVSTGGLTVAVGGVSGTNRTAAGTYREYIKATGTGSLTFTPGNTAFRGVVDTVTVKEVGTAPADQVTVWVEDQGGTAGKATLYIRGENGTVVGIGGDGFTFGANDEDLTLAYTANTLTLAGGVLNVPTGSSIVAGTSSSNANLGGVLSVNTTAVGNVGAGEDDLMTYSLPANALSANGKAIRVTMFGKNANNANAKTLNVYFGSIKILNAFSFQLNAENNWEVHFTVVRTGSSAQSIFLFTGWEASLRITGPIYSTATQTDTSAITIKATGTATADNDIVQHLLMVEMLN